VSYPLAPFDPTAPPWHPSLEETAALAGMLHAGQQDQSGAPYLGHLVRVSRTLGKLFPGATMAERHAAWLHDALEDTDITADGLRGRGYAAEVITLIAAVTRDKATDATYADWIEALAQTGPRGAIRVKIADLMDNSDPERLAQLPEERARSLGARYAAALARLRAALDLPPGAFAPEDDPDDDIVALTVRLPAMTYWHLEQAAHAADLTAAGFAATVLVDQALGGARTTEDQA